LASRRVFLRDAQGTGAKQGPADKRAGEHRFPVLSRGTYFLTVDLSPLGLNETDEAFCKRIVTDLQVAADSGSAFYEKMP